MEKSWARFLPRAYNAPSQLKQLGCENASGRNMTSPSEQPNLTEHQGTGRLSKVAGAGVGGVIVVMASWLDLSSKTTLVIQALAPSVSVFIGAVGPSFNRIVTNIGKWIGLQLTLRGAAAHAASMPAGSDGRKVAEENIRLIHGMLNDLIHDTMQLFRTKRK